MKTRLKLNNCFRTIFAIIFSFILLESMLFLYSRYLLWSRRSRGDSQKYATQIVCIGDSHTFGVGTSNRYSYPKLLETLLNYNNYPQRFSVVNLGIPGASTRSQAEELISFFAKDSGRTKITILLTGRNNSFEVKNWKDDILPGQAPYKNKSLRSIKFLQSLLNYIIKKERPDIENTIPEHQTSGDYLDFYLEKIRRLCIEHSAKLVLLSYYNSSNERIKRFAKKYNIPYFDFTEDFKRLFAEDRKKYLSPDMSHMNRIGYKFFAEQLYEHLFLNQDYLDLKINPLARKLQEASFYTNKEETEQLIKWQLLRIEQYRNSQEYPFELIHLGHIYMEFNDQESARKFYMMGLLSSDYLDNNTIVSPIINWYLKNGQQKDALKICEEILMHNPHNTVAQHYRNRLILTGK